MERCPLEDLGMKKISFMLLISTAIISFGSVRLPLARADETKTFIGTIESFRPTFARPPKWPIARFTAVAENGEKIEVYVLGRDTTVTDIDGKSIENKRPQVGKKVEIKYSTGEHEIYGGMRYEAISIRYVPSDYVSQPVTITDQPNSAAPGAAHDKNTLIGTVKDIAGIAPGLSNNWTYAKIVVVADSGNESAFFINKNTALTNEKGVTNPPLPKKDQRVEIKYSIGEDGRNEAVSVRYVPMDYAQEQTSSAPAIVSVTTSNASGEKIFIGKIESSSSTFHIPSKRKIVIVADNGDKLTVFVSREIAIRDMHASPTRIGKRAEVKYSPAANGENEAVSFRYVPSDYVQQPAALAVSTQTPAATTVGQSNIFIGTVEKVTPTVGRRPEEPRCKILAVADSGEKSLFFVPKNSPVTDVAGRDMSEGGMIGGLLLKKGQRIEIKYSIITNDSIITNGQNGADSIRCLD